MKREELIAKGFTEEQVTDILNMFHANDKQKDEQIKAMTNQIEADKNIQLKNSELQKQLDELNRAKLTEQEQIELDKKETAKKLAEADKIYNTAKAKEILAGLDVPDTLIGRLVTSNEEETIANANAYKNQFEIYKSQIEKSTKASIQNLDGKPQPTNIPQGDNVMNLEKYNKMTLTEKMRWKKENPEAFNTLMGED